MQVDLKVESWKPWCRMSGWLYVGQQRNDLAAPDKRIAIPPFLLNFWDVEHRAEVPDKGLLVAEDPLTVSLTNISKVLTLQVRVCLTKSLL